MSKTQDKRRQRNMERVDFLIARKKTQYSMFEQAVAIGEKLYEDNKDKLSAEEIEQLDSMRKENQRLLEEVANQIRDLEKELNDSADKDPQA